MDKVSNVNFDKEVIKLNIKKVKKLRFKSVLRKKTNQSTIDCISSKGDMK